MIPKIMNIISLRKEERMQELQIFNNQEFGTIRTTEINGVPYFVGKEVAPRKGA